MLLISIYELFTNNRLLEYKKTQHRPYYVMIREILAVLFTEDTLITQLMPGKDLSNVARLPANNRLLI